MHELPPRARLYLVGVVAAASACVAWSTVRYDGGWPAVGVFGLLCVLTSLRATATARNVFVSVSFIVVLAAVATTGPHGAALVALGSAFATRREGRFPLYKRAFNAAQLALTAFAAGLVFVGIADVVGDPDSTRRHVALQLAATVAAAFVYFAVNNAFVAGILSLTSGLSLRRVWVGTFSWLAVGYVGYGILGLVMAGLYRQMGPASAVFFLVPLYVARSAFTNYSQLREAYDSTVRAFAQAVETKDYYTRGHSERVARVTELIAREWGMREDRVQVIRIAGMLHDVGKLGVPTRVLQKQGKLNQLEFEAIKLHPLRGQEMLCEIDFLREALVGVYHHHERMDGRGYPMGLTDAEIPEFARIIMVADAFDSMTSTRSYRQAKSVEDAVAELRRCQGVQFDPKVVDCLVAGIAKHGWEPHPEEFHGERVTRDGDPVEAVAVADD